MKKIKISVVLMLIFLLITVKMVLVSCTKDQTPTPPEITEIVFDSICPDSVLYQTEIKTLIDLNCATSGCHNTETHAGGYDLTTYASVSMNAQAMFESMQPGATPMQMPLGDPFPDSVIQRFECWMKQGKLEN